MVTHIFLLSKIWDASLEAQVVSRAHRMGATGAVVVEQLIMEGTVEQQMHRTRQRQRLPAAARADQDEIRALSDCAYGLQLLVVQPSKQRTIDIAVDDMPRACFTSPRTGARSPLSARMGPLNAMQHATSTRLPTICLHSDDT